MNPRARFYQATRFRGGLFQPLRHLSAANAYKDYQRGKEGTTIRGKKNRFFVGCWSASSLRMTTKQEGRADGTDRTFAERGDAGAD